MIISCNLMHLLCPPQSPRDTGLGNTLFQLATIYALAKEHHFEINLHELVLYCNLLQNFGFDHNKKIFNNILTKYSSDIVNDKSELISESEKYYVEQYLDENFLNRVKDNIGNNVKIQGYFQSHLYFDKYRNDILDLFKIDMESENLIKNNYPILFNENVICIAIHVRMNYADCINYNFNYFAETIDFFKKKFSNVHFLVFSNNISSIENWFNDKNLYTYVTGNIDYIDLWIMSLCKHNIITHSTFSWWGAYLNNNPDKIVTFPTETLKILTGGLNRKFKFLQRRTEYYMKEWKNFDINTLIRY
jgi:hypothetical protein